MKALKEQKQEMTKEASSTMTMGEEKEAEAFTRMSPKN